MNPNDFRLFKEIKIHLDEISSLENKIQDEKTRIDSIKRQIESKESELSVHETNHKELHEKISQEEKELYEVEKKLETSKSHLEMAHNQKEAEALEHEQENLGNSAEERQELLLTLMDEEETLKYEIEKAKTFINGSKETLNEIQIEVEDNVSKIQQSIDSESEDWKSHARQLSDSSKAIFKNSLKKFKDSTPFADLKGSSCKRCGYGIDSTLRRAVENQTSLEICPGCNRIFLI